MNTILLPHEALAEYTAAPVGNYLVAPANPCAGQLRLNELTAPEEIQRLADVQRLDHETGMALIDKKFPHARRDIMWLQAEEEPLATLTEYVNADPGLLRSERLFGQIARSASMLEAQGDYVSVSWSSDPETLHRPSMQGEKRLHFHLTARSQNELDALPSVTTSIGELSFVDRRRLAEEFSYVSTEFMHDYISEKHLTFPVKKLHPTVLSLEIGDWGDLADPTTIGNISKFIALMEHTYSNVMGVLGEEHGDGLQAKGIFADYAEIIAAASGLDTQTHGAQLLGHFLLKIMPWCNSRLENRLDIATAGHNLPKHFLTAVTPLQGLAYAGCFSKVENKLYLHVRLCKFSDLGGAGCAIINGMPVRIKKGKKPMTPDELVIRKNFVNSVVRASTD